MLFGLVLPELGWIGWGAVPIAVAALITMFFKADTKVENRRRVAIDISEKFNENGFTMLEELFKSYAVGDKSGMLSTLIELKKVVSNPLVFEAHLARLFSVQLSKAVQDPAKRMEVSQALKEIEVLEAADLITKMKDSKTNLTTIVGPLKPSE